MSSCTQRLFSVQCVNLLPEPRSIWSLFAAAVGVCILLRLTLICVPLLYLSVIDVHFTQQNSYPLACFDELTIATGGSLSKFNYFFFID